MGRDGEVCGVVGSDGNVWGVMGMCAGKEVGVDWVC